MEKRLGIIEHFPDRKSSSGIEKSGQRLITKKIFRLIVMLLKFVVVVIIFCACTEIVNGPFSYGEAPNSMYANRATHIQYWDDKSKTYVFYDQLTGPDFYSTGGRMPKVDKPRQRNYTIEGNKVSSNVEILVHGVGNIGCTPCHSK